MCPLGCSQGLQLWGWFFSCENLIAELVSDWRFYEIIAGNELASDILHRDTTRCFGREFIREKLLYVSHHHGGLDFLRLIKMNSMFAKDRDYVRMNFMSFKDRDIGQEAPKVGRFGEKVSKEDDIGTPLKLLHEGEGHRVTVELKNGDMCRGTLIESENNWTSQLEDITYVSREEGGQKHGHRRKAFKLDLVFIRGRRMRFIILPDMLKHAHLFKLPNTKTKEEKDDDLRLTLRLLHLTNYSQKIAAEQGRFYL